MPWWILQDGGGDVVAVVKDNGWSAGGNGATASTVAGQYVYDAYGSVVAAESLATHPVLHLAHKGLFFDRLDVGVVDSVGAEAPRLDQSAHATYYMRNRWYSPETGRFLQRDPNATSMVLIESAASHGRGIGAAVAALSPDAMYGDGHSLYQYLGSNPLNRRDPLGLSADPFDDVDAYIAADAAQKSNFLSGILDGIHAATAIMASLISYLPIPGAGLLSDITLALLNGDDVWQVIAQSALGIIPGGNLLMMAMSITGAIEDITRSADLDEAYVEDDETVALSPFDAFASDASVAGIYRSKKVVGAKHSTRGYSSIKFKSRKEAFEAAKMKSAKKRTPMFHKGHKQNEWPHFHPVDARGRPVPGPHYRFPPSRM